MKQTLKRESRFSYAVMHVLFNTKLQLIKRDAPMLAKYGIKNLNIAEFESLKQEYSKTLDDQNMVLSQKQETFNKNLIDKLLRTQMRFVKNAIENSFNQTNMNDLLASLDCLSKKSCAELSVSADNVSMFFERTNISLDVFGITNDFVLQFNTTRQNFKEIMFLAELSKLDRNEQTAKRHAVENRVNETLKLICKTGKMVWMMEGNAALYNEYNLPNQYIYRKSSVVQLKAIES